jgi:hypothetical protein
MQKIRAYPDGRKTHGAWSSILAKEPHVKGYVLSMASCLTWQALKEQQFKKRI